MLRGANGWLARANDEIDMGLDDFRCMIVKRTDAQPKTRLVDHKILSIDETVRLHRIEKRGIVRRIAWTQMQVTEAIGPPRFLRQRCKMAM